MPSYWSALDLTILSFGSLLMGWTLCLWYQKRGVHKDQLHIKYLQGVNYYLTEKPEKALDLFNQLLENDSDAVELYITIGILYRKRGEFERAIQLHQTIASRTTFTKEHRFRCMLELARDYLGAGILDHAETILREVALYAPLKKEVGNDLLTIYKQEKDWERAIDIAISLQQQKELIGGNIVLAHLYCEQGEQMHAFGKLREAEEAVEEALEWDQACIRAYILSADIAMVRGKIKYALKSLERVGSIDPCYIVLVIERMRQCYILLNNKDGFEQYVADICSQQDTILLADVLLTYAETIKRKESCRAAIQFLLSRTGKNMTPKVLYWILENLTEAQNSIVNERTLRKKDFQEIIDANNLNKSSYFCHCKQCGFKTQGIFWQCPNCQTWGEVRLLDE